MQKIRVLILEDDRDIIDLAATALGDDFECFAAGNGLEGIQLAQKGEPDLILCDIMMPIMDGKEFVRRLRKFSGFERTPVVYLTAMSSREQIRDGYQTGAVLYLTKPIDPARLKRNIELYIEDHAIVPRTKVYPIEELLFSTADDPPTPTPAPSRRPQPRPEPPRAETPHVEPPRAETPRPVEPVSRLAKRPENPPAAAPRPAPEPAPPAEPAPTAKASGTGSSLRPTGPHTDPHKNPMLRNLIASKGAPSGRKKVRVLVVTNDEDALKLIGARLGAAFETIETRDGMGGVETATRYKPDLMIVDAILPRMNGEQVLNMLRKNPDFTETPIIFISDKGIVRDSEHAAKLGATLCLVKPFAASALMEAIDSVVSSPGFVIRTDRIGISQAHMEQFQRRETHRGGGMPSIEQLEREHLENVLKRQLK